MSCAVCEGETRLIAKTRNGYELLRCRTCDLVQASPMPTQEELSAFYQGFTYSKPDESELQRQIAYTKRGTKRIVAEVAALSGHPVHKVLDFGGGLGFFANALSQYYEEVTLFDLDGQSRDFARERFPSRFKVVDSANEALGQKYDLILLNQVIEHVPDPVGFLRPFKDALEPGGLLIVTTPNNRTNDALVRPDVFWHYSNRLAASKVQSASLMLTDSWLCCDPPRHLYAFNGGNLGEAGSRAGFELLRTATAHFDEDPYGQPKYSYQGMGGLRSAARSAMYIGSRISALLGRLGDRNKTNGSTLIAHFTAL